MSTIHTNLVGATAKIRSELVEIPEFYRPTEHAGKEGEIVAVYLDNVSMVRFLLALNPSTSHRAKRPLIEVQWFDVEWIRQDKTVLLCE